MAEENSTPTSGTETPPAEPTEQGPDSPPSAETQNTDTTGHMIPKTRFDEVNERAKAERERADKLQAELDKQAAERQQAEEDRLKKQGEFEQLYTAEQAKAADLQTKLDAATTRLDALQQRFNAMLDKQKEGVPDHIKPLLDKMDALEAMDYLTENADKLLGVEGGPRKQPAPRTNARDGVGGTGEREITLRRRVKL